MSKFEVKCDWCGKEFDCEVRRIGEAQRNNWRQFCSPKCLRLAKLTGETVACDNASCQKKFYRPKGNIHKFSHHFCSQSCAAVVNNKITNRKSKIKKLSKKCGSPQCIQLIDSNQTYCSRKCFRECVRLIPPLNKINPNIYANRVISKIKNFVRLYNRIPLKRELQNDYRPARIAFGTWNNAVKAAGFNPNQLKFTHKYIANDKHICDSLAEKIIDDWLYARKIKHQRNVYYPGQKRFKTDFKIGDYWFEFFGLEGQLKRYDELKKKKLHLIKKLNLKLIKIYPLDLFPKNKLDKVLKILLN